VRLVGLEVCATRKWAFYPELLIVYKSDIKKPFFSNRRLFSSLKRKRRIQQHLIDVLV
jgi:hypothetical protein